MALQGDAIKHEMRLAAIEYLLCRVYVAMIQASGVSSEQTEHLLQRQISGAANQKFPGLDPAMSDLASAEFGEAVERLV
ncbi:MAG: hypothetical protein ACYC1L_00745, partial [Alphaproteobacteria bacterium]